MPVQAFLRSEDVSVVKGTAQSEDPCEGLVLAAHQVSAVGRVRMQTVGFVANMLDRLATAWQALDTSKKQVQKPVFRQLSSLGKLQKTCLSGSVGRLRDKSPVSKRSKSTHSKSHTFIASVRELSKSKVSLKPISREGLSAETVESLYSARCTDLQLPVLPDQTCKFHEFCGRNIRKRRLFLEDTGLGLHSAGKIADILRSTPLFAYIYLGRNPLKDSGVRVLLPALLDTSALVHISLNSVDLSSDCAAQLFDSLHSHPSIASLDCSSDSGVHKNRLAGKGAEALSRLLQGNRVIYAVNIAGTALGLEGAETLAAGLSDNWTLQWLDISNNGIYGKMWETLGKAIDKSKIKYLAIGENRLNPVGAEYVGKMAASVYGRCPILRLNMPKCDLGPQGLRKFFPGVSQNPFIRTLNLEQNAMTSTSVIEMYQFLTDTMVLEELNLSRCELAGDSIDTVAAGLSKNRTVVRLHLAWNGFGDFGAKVLAAALERNCTLKALDLTSNLIRTEGGAALAHSLDLNRALETLILTDNAIGDATGELLADLTKRNRTLTTLLLHSNPIKPAFLQAIRKSAETNRTRKQRNLAPLLRSEVRSLTLPSSAFTDIENELQIKKKEAIEVATLVEIQQKRMERIIEEEGNRLTALQNDYEQWQETRRIKEKELQELLDIIQNGEE